MSDVEQEMPFASDPLPAVRCEPPAYGVAMRSKKPSCAVQNSEYMSTIELRIEDILLLQFWGTLVTSPNAAWCARSPHARSAGFHAVDP